MNRHVKTRNRYNNPLFSHFARLQTPHSGISPSDPGPRTPDPVFGFGYATWRAFVLLFLFTPMAFSQTHIGLVFDGPDAKNTELARALDQELQKLAQGGESMDLPANLQLESGGTLAGAQAALDQLSKKSSASIIVTMGPIASAAACAHGPWNKPVIALFAPDREIAPLPRKEAGSGVANLTYVTVPGTFKRDLELFKKTVPFGRMAVVTPSAFAGDVAGFAKAADSLGVSAVVIPAGVSPQDTLPALPADIQAVYASNLLHFDDANWQVFIAGCNERHLPCFSALGKALVEQGMLASALPDDELQQRVRRAALNIRRILMGEAPESLPVDLPATPQLVINMATARTLGITPSWDARTDATLLNDLPQESAREITLSGTVQEAIAANLDLQAADKHVLAGAQNIREAKSKLKPSIELSTLGLNVDGDRAQGSNGLQPEWTIKTSITLTQVLFAEPAFANIEAQKHLQRGRELERERQRLDLVLETAAAYVNSLRARAYDRIQRDLLYRVREHLQTAQVRKNAGIGGPIEVSRWQAEVATVRKNVTDAEAKRIAADVALNRLINHPQDETIHPVEISSNDTAFAADENTLAGCFNAPESFKRLQAFFLNEGLTHSPELGQYEAGIAAQERGLKSTERSYYMPIVAAQAQFSEDLYKGGKGASSDLPLPLGIKFSLAEQDDMEWQVGVKASLPVYAGGARKAARIKAEETLAKLKLERLSVEGKLEQAIRQASQVTQSSYVAIGQAQESAAAALKTYEVVKNAYAQGEASLLELLDAQTARSVTEELVLNARYEYLLYIIRTMRASNSFDFLMTPEERAAWQQRLDEFVPNP